MVLIGLVMRFIYVFLVEIMEVKRLVSENFRILKKNNC